MTSSDDQRQPNRLIRETSPYLLQHARNPVDWYPWGPEALRAAVEQNRPILLSIGYSACHWCHVMERESFEDHAIAALMNQHFVCIKVDREERPDLDEIYMQATVAMNQGQGGWPMTVFLTPEQEPFFAGTYFPPEDRWGRPGFPTVLKKVAEYWKHDPAGLRTQARELTNRLKDELKISTPVSVNETILDDAVAQFKAEFDERNGGFGHAPKFPPAAGLSLLLRCYRRNGDRQTLHMVTRTLDAMASGGMYDHIGGGFARYSTDARWLVPHFEKMLYDNALLARTYLEAFQVTKQPSYRQVTIEVLDYVLREMTDASGGFYSATDADSEGVEGKFFVWTPAEVQAVVSDGEDGTRFCACYDITEAGNWEHKSIPNRLRSLESVAKDLDVTVDELTETMGRVRPLLYRARQQRVPPALDDKVITAWNGMMISAMAEAGRVLGIDRYLQGARRATDFLWREHRATDGTLLRTSRQGRAHLAGVLEDYAYLAEGCLDLYEASGQERDLHAARDCAERILKLFLDEAQGGFYTTAVTQEPLVVRGREGADGATPSGNAVAASALARLGYHLYRRDFRDAAVGAIRAYGRQMTRYPRAFAKSLAVMDFLTEGPIELAYIGRSQDPGLAALKQVARDIYLPNRILATGDPAIPATHPLLKGKDLVDGQAALYVCRNFACQRPMTDPFEVSESLRSVSAKRSVPEETWLRGSMLSGMATTEGTARYAARIVSHAGHQAHKELGFVPFGRHGLTVSRLGFGTYRVDTRDPDHRDALRRAFSRGINVVDTSTNYMDGDSERLVGIVLQGLIKAQELARDEVVVISKIGYVQGQNLKHARAREEAGRPYPEMVKHGDDLWHCLHPDFLADQLTASLDRLGLQTLDVCLLHNPEYFFSDPLSRDDRDLTARREVFYKRLEKAFAYFESQIQSGRLRYYGVSSNTATAAPDDPEATSLSAMLRAATVAATAQGQSRHHFAVLQCPMNLYEAQAALAPNTGDNHLQTVLNHAQREGIAVLVNRPLNAIPVKNGGVFRLAECPLEKDAPRVEQQLEIVNGLEDEYRKTIAPLIPHSGQGTPPVEFFQWAKELTRIRPQIQGMEHWEQIEHHMIGPHVNQVVQAITRLVSGEAAQQWDAWRERYLPELVLLIRGLKREATEQSRVKTAALAATIDPLLPSARRGDSLSRKALWVLTSTPGVTTVLNGMRTVAYVDDAMGILGWDPLSAVQPVYIKVKEASRNN